jgi:hypothetical protein
MRALQQLLDDLLITSSLIHMTLEPELLSTAQLTARFQLVCVVGSRTYPFEQHGGGLADLYNAMKRVNRGACAADEEVWGALLTKLNHILDTEPVPPDLEDLLLVPTVHNGATLSDRLVHVCMMC